MKYDKKSEDRLQNHVSPLVFRIITTVVSTSLAVFMLSGCTADEEPQPEPVTEQTVQQAPIVVVYNGCGVSGSAHMVAEALRGAGYDIGNGNGENARSFLYPKTLVVDFTGRLEEARPLADRLGAPLIQQISHDQDLFGTIGVIVGADYRARLQQFTEG